MHYHDFADQHPHLSGSYSGDGLVARLAYEEYLRRASEERLLREAIAHRRPRLSLVARFGATLVRWGEQLQASGAAVTPMASLDARS